MSRCDQPSASCARSFRPERAMLVGSRSAGHGDTTVARFLCCEHYPRSVNNRCGEGGECFPVLIHTRFLYQQPDAHPQPGIQGTTDASTVITPIFNFSTSLLLLRFIILIKQ